MDEKTGSLTNEQKQKLKRAFMKASRDNGKTVNKENFMIFAQLYGLNPTKKQINDALISNLKPDETVFTLEECESIIWSLSSECELERELREAFLRFDVDFNGYLDANEFRRIMESYGEKLNKEELVELMEIADINHDGKIDYEEFVKLMTESMPDY